MATAVAICTAWSGAHIARARAARGALLPLTVPPSLGRSTHPHALRRRRDHAVVPPGAACGRVGIILASRAGRKRADTAGDKRPSVADDGAPTAPASGVTDGPKRGEAS